MNFSHDMIEKNSALMIVLIILVVAVGGLVEIVPLYFQKSTTEPVAGLKPYTPVQLAGRDIYLREGCYNCHSQMIRPFRAETERYGHYSVAGEFVYDHPFQWGSKRTGPDLQRRRPAERGRRLSQGRRNCRQSLPQRWPPHGPARDLEPAECDLSRACRRGSGAA